MFEDLCVYVLLRERESARDIETESGGGGGGEASFAPSRARPKRGCSAGVW